MRAALLLLILVSASPAQEFRAGAAVADITPPVGYPMWGYAARKDAPSLGVLDPLKARALVLEVGSTRIAIVALDLGRAPTRASTAFIRKQVQAEAAIDHIFLVGVAHASRTGHRAGPLADAARLLRSPAGV